MGRPQTILITRFQRSMCSLEAGYGGGGGGGGGLIRPLPGILHAWQAHDLYLFVSHVKPRTFLEGHRDTGLRRSSEATKGSLKSMCTYEPYHSR